MREDYGVFILSHQRADNLKSLAMLTRGKCHAPIYIVVDDQDRELELYRKKYENLLVFNKDEIYEKYQWDTMDNFHRKESATFGRYFISEVAKELGFQYYVEMDDDLNTVQAFLDIEKNKRRKTLKNYDRLFGVLIKWLENIGAEAVGIAGGGDIIGGYANRNLKEGIKRRIANLFVARPDSPLPFMGSVNEDVVLCTRWGGIGKLVMSYRLVHFSDMGTQQMAGGMTQTYLDEGTYTKAFYVLMASPSNVKISIMQTDHIRIHHRIAKESAYVKILNEKWRKTENEE